jgi:hypothetical protein
MTILFKLDSAGGFTVGDTATGRTAYAYPTSANASQARQLPYSVATEMMIVENSLGSWRDTSDCITLDEARLADLSNIKASA